MKLLPVLTLRDIVTFPHLIIPLFVGRSKSLAAIDYALNHDSEILVVTQKDPQVTDPKVNELYSVGTVATIKQFAKLSDGNVKILIEGMKRVRISSFPTTSPSLLAEYEEIPAASSDQEELSITRRSVLRSFESYLKATGKPSDEFLNNLESIQDIEKLIALLASQLNLKLSERQDLLETSNLKEALEKISTFILSEIELFKLDKKLKNKVRQQIEKNQKDYYLQEQLSAIHKELGNDQDPRAEAEEFEKRLEKKKMPAYAKERAQKEIKRFRASAGHSAEITVLRNYIELILDLPWDEVSKDSNNLKDAETILANDHHGLHDIKERILEFLAVRAKVKTHKSPVLCFVGPPGVGKTSLAQSIAKSLNRKLERISLGGLRDEAELRGHRRTYIGALPGKIISAIRKAGTSNPIILLDEIDKLGFDYRGDPSSVLLEVLDPEQNKNFTDHYLDLEYDLSKVLFITTANTLDTLSIPLKDRMEIISLSGYNDDEKISIAKNFLVPKEKKSHGLEDFDLEISESILNFIVRNYTREAGVRSLQREIAKICRKLVRKIATQSEDQIAKLQLDEKSVQELLGIPRFRQSSVEATNEIGLVTGLAWTAAGGDVLTIESVAVPGNGKIQITGQLGKVMQESVKAALSYVKVRASDYGVPEDFFFNHDLHIHVPEGAIPKDGPSAGITIATALLSIAAKLPVDREIGMTGEITLRGRVLPIGGLKEKLMAAKRAGLKKILYPIENQRDLSEVPQSVKDGLELIPVFHMDEVVEQAFIFPDEPDENYPRRFMSKARVRPLASAARSC
ncbi:MAG: endopeptidase La [Deltaproteobacteria bacterium]|nr:endopeptidase La [Deltaproteobacteria bacterium]